MDRTTFDVIVIGAGIAGATTAAHLSEDRKVALLEAEDQPGFHSTGRSAAIWIQNYGPPEVRVLTGLSRPFFEEPPAEFTDGPILHRRPVVFLNAHGQQAQFEQFMRDSIGARVTSADEIRAKVPALKPEYADQAAVEDDAFDMDVAALHQGFLRQHRARGGVLALRSRTGRIARRDGAWQVDVAGGETFQAPVVVNAAGAWGDEVAAQAGLPRLGLQPKRRTGVIIDPAPYQVEHWPMLHDVAHTWYCRPEARTKLMVCPADETDDMPHDVQPDELDVAIAIDRMQQALSIEVRRIEHSWAGLRTFTLDRNLAFGFSKDALGFFWCVGQGGYGIQTSPAAGKLVADVIAGRDPGPAGRIMAAIDPDRFS